MLPFNLPIGPMWHLWAFLPAFAVLSLVFHYGMHVEWRSAINAAFWLKIASGFLISFITIPVSFIATIFGQYWPIQLFLLLLFFHALTDTIVELSVLQIFNRYFGIPVTIGTAGWLGASNVIIFTLVSLSLTTFPDLEHDRGARERLSEQELQKVAERFADELAFMDAIGQELFKGEQISEVRLEPEWISGTREAAQALEFIEFAIVVRSGDARQDEEITYIVGKADGNDEWLSSLLNPDTAYGCLPPIPCMSRLIMEDGTANYFMDSHYGAMHYALEIRARLPDPYSLRP